MEPMVSTAKPWMTSMGAGLVLVLVSVLEHWYPTLVSRRMTWSATHQELFQLEWAEHVNKIRVNKHVYN